MGMKCEYCRTGHGGNKFVADLLMGVCGCGKCTGVFTELEKRHTLVYLNDQRDNVKKYIENFQNLLKNIDKLEIKLKEYKPVDKI